MALKVTEGTDLASFLEPNAFASERFGHRTTVRETVEVPIRRLDGLLDDLVGHIPDPRIFLKLDTQGFDLRVLEGARRSMGRVLAFQSEVSVKRSLGPGTAARRRTGPS